MAEFIRLHDEWRCVDAHEAEPQAFLLWLANGMLVGKWDYVVYERFILEPERAGTQAGSEMETSQMIGVIRWIHSQLATANRWPGGDVVLAGQTNKIKTPTRSLLRSRKIPSQARRQVAGGHALDAELHGAYYIVRTLEDTLAAPTGPVTQVREKRA